MNPSSRYLPFLISSASFSASISTRKEFKSAELIAMLQIHMSLTDGCLRMSRRKKRKDGNIHKPEPVDSEYLPFRVDDRVRISSFAHRTCAVV